jgi:hypothetical protein
MRLQLLQASILGFGHVMGEIDMPWSPRSRQTTGNQTEKQIIKKRGGRSHPMSGAGSIKWDGSTEDSLLEIKSAKVTHSIKGKMLRDLLADANKQGKDALYIIHFEDADVTLTGIITRGKE